MKRIVRACVVSFLLLCVCLCAYAQGDTAGILAGNQDYLMLATVVDITDSAIILAPHQLIYLSSDKAESSSLNENISVDKFRYSYCDEHSDISLTPRVGDNVFISLNKLGSRYAMANGAYKVSSVDYKMLTFYASESMRNKECLAEIVTLAYFVRTNGSMRKFNFENGVLTSDADGSSITLYPTDNITDVITFLDIDGKIVDAAKTEDVIIHGQEKAEEKEADYRWLVSYAIILAGVVLGGIVVYNVNMSELIRKNSKKGAK